MPITYELAVREIFKPCVTNWAAFCAAHTVAGSKLNIQGLPGFDVLDNDLFFGRISQRTISSPQRTFRTTEQKRYRTVGALLIQVYGPMSQADSGAFYKCRKLCEALQDLYRAYPKNSVIEFLNVSIEELPNDGKRFRFNVVADYNYDEVK